MIDGDIIRRLKKHYESHHFHRESRKEYQVGFLLKNKMGKGRNERENKKKEREREGEGQRSPEEEGGRPKNDNLNG